MMEAVDICDQAEETSSWTSETGHCHDNPDDGNEEYATTSSAELAVTTSLAVQPKDEDVANSSGFCGSHSHSHSNGQDDPSAASRPSEAEQRLVSELQNSQEGQTASLRPSSLRGHNDTENNEDNDGTEDTNETGDTEYNSVNDGVGRSMWVRRGTNDNSDEEDNDYDDRGVRVEDIELGLARLGDHAGNSSDDDNDDLMTVAVLPTDQENAWRSHRSIGCLHMTLRILVFPVLVLTSVAIPIVLVMFCLALMVVALLVLLCVYYCCSPRHRGSPAVPFHVLIRQILEAVEDETTGGGLDNPATPKYTREEIQNAMVRRTLMEYECHDEHGLLVDEIAAGLLPTDEATREERMHQDMFPLAPKEPSCGALQSGDQQEECSPNDDDEDEKGDGDKPKGLFAKRKCRRQQRQKQKELEAEIQSRNETYDLRVAQRPIAFRTDPKRSHSKLFIHTRTYVFSEPLNPVEVTQNNINGLNDSNNHFNSDTGNWLGLHSNITSNHRNSNVNNNMTGVTPAASMVQRAELLGREQPPRQRTRGREQPEGNDQQNGDNGDDDDSFGGSSSSSERYYFPMPLFDSSSSSSSSSSESPSESPTSEPSPSVASSEESYLVEDNDDIGNNPQQAEIQPQQQCENKPESDIEVPKVVEPISKTGTTVTSQAILREERDLEEEREDVTVDLEGNSAVLDVETGLKVSSKHGNKPTLIHQEGLGMQHKDGNFTSSKTGQDMIDHAAEHQLSHVDTEEAKTEISATPPEELNLQQNHTMTVPNHFGNSGADTPLEIREEVESTVMCTERKVAADRGLVDSTEYAPPLLPAFTSDARGTSTYCNICLLEYEIGDVVVWSRRPNGCHHAWHEDCLLDWLKRKPTCPNCRQEFFAVEDSPQSPALSPTSPAGGAEEDNTESEAVHTILPQSMHTIHAESEDARPTSRYW